MLQTGPSRRPLLQSLLGLARQAWSSSSSSTSSSGSAGEQQQWQAGRAWSGQQCSSTTSAVPPARPPRDPWTPSRLLDKRKAYPKRMRHLITTLENEYVAKVNQQRQLPSFRSGDILEVQVAVPEVEGRVYTYRGVCLGRANKGPRSWLKMYNVFPDVGGFVQHLPIYMPDLVALKVVGRTPRAHRSKLYHLKDNESGAHTYQEQVSAPLPQQK
ncbi:50S ribosomal protein L19 [Raphidocelis subcapitata]|uniref:50S ribosomal protein L19 n=1 Tax=Raphidocelis subcapitata TaxID=307507 RepID=A0A2V0PJT6_9CHLO|nr:50S ribosomal protein L19 [Raphidocelis subcapitata]|eukprot:GBF98170.1 50S ribosomal protein L19 [Raphidocelis subcapitata]